MCAACPKPQREARTHLPGSSLSAPPKSPPPCRDAPSQSAAREKLRYPDEKKPPDHTMQSKDGWDSCNSCHRERQEAAPRAMPPMRMPYDTRPHSPLPHAPPVSARRTKRCAMPPSPKECPSRLARTQTHGRYIYPHPAWRPRSTASDWFRHGSHRNARLSPARPVFSLTSWPLSPCPKPSGADTLLLAPSSVRHAEVSQTLSMSYPRHVHRTPRNRKSINRYKPFMYEFKLSKGGHFPPP